VSFDNVCKLLASKYPADFVQWLIPESSTNVEDLVVWLEENTSS